MPHPRVGTAARRHLTEASSRGFSVAAFADQVLGVPLLPWQRELAVRALELNPDGTYRFRTVLCLVGRQNGKSHMLKVLALWRIYVERARLVVGAAQNLQIAKEAWRGAAIMASETPALMGEFVRWYKDNNDPHVLFAGDARYKVVAANDGAGRGLSVDLLILDELRMQRDWGAWAALSATTTARPNGQIWCISNAGDDQSVVLNQLREAALSGQDPSIGLFEWSAADGCELDDVAGWAAANPGLGHTVSEQAIRSALGTDPPAVFRTERLCQRVDVLDGAVDVLAWRDCADSAGSLAAHGDRLAACFDVAPDGGHATLSVAAVLPDGRVRVEVVAAWRDMAVARRELRELLVRVGPVAVGWFPAGPAAEFAPLLRGAGDMVEIKGTDQAVACMNFAALVRARQVLHPGDPLLDAHVAGAARLRRGDRFEFVRAGFGGGVDALYAAAGAVFVALTMPEPVPVWAGPLVI